MKAWEAGDSCAPNPFQEKGHFLGLCQLPVFVPHALSRSEISSSNRALNILSHSLHTLRARSRVGILLALCGCFQKLPSLPSLINILEEFGHPALTHRPPSCGIFWPPSYSPSFPEDEASGPHLALHPLPPVPSSSLSIHTWDLPSLWPPFSWSPSFLMTNFSPLNFPLLSHTLDLIMYLKLPHLPRHVSHHPSSRHLLRDCL